MQQCGARCQLFILKMWKDPGSALFAVVPSYQATTLETEGVCQHFFQEDAEVPHESSERPKM